MSEVLFDSSDSYVFLVIVSRKYSNQVGFEG